MRFVPGFAGVLALSLCQCVSSSLSNTAKSRGAVDLQCPVENVAAYRAEGGGYVARGCGRWAEYDCIRSGRGINQSSVCVAHQRAEVHELPVMLPDSE